MSGPNGTGKGASGAIVTSPTSGATNDGGGEEDTPAEARYYGTKVPANLGNNWDAIVIGSGMGGMTTAALLAKLGQRVLVLEQHYVPGGFTHTFRRKKWTWDVGVHAVGEVDSHAVLGKVLADLSDDQLEWRSLGGVYDEFWFPDLRIDFPDTKAGFAEALESAFPGEKAAIQRYFADVKEVANAMRRYYLARALPPSVAWLSDRVIASDAQRMLVETTAERLSKITSNERLKTVLTAQWGYYGVIPERSSFAIHALVARHFMHGGYYPVGGSARIADTLLGGVARRGGYTRIKADVQHILVRNGRAIGVRLQSGEELLAPRVVSAVGGIATVTRLLPPTERLQPWARSIADLRSSPCHICLYIGFRGDIRSAGASAANKWFYETWSHSDSDWNAEKSDSRARVLYCSFPSLKDPTHDPGPDQLHTGEVVTFVPYSLVEKWQSGRWMKRGGDYEALKKDIEKRILAQFLEHMPALRDKIAYTELSTPVSTVHFTRAPAGAIYGIEPTPQRYRTRNLRPRTPIKGLYLSGADMASVGVMGAMVGGLLCGLSMEPLRGVNYVRSVLKQRK